MNKLISLFFLLAVFTSCSYDADLKTSVKREKTEDYQLVIPDGHKSLLILFPCYPCDAENTNREFDIITKAANNGIAVLMMNMNQHLWLNDAEKIKLAEIINDAVKGNGINTNNTYIGGFSSGGNVAVLLSDYLSAMKSTFQPKGVFVVDSPLDLLGLYENAKKDINKEFSEFSVKEAKWIVEMMDEEFGMSDSSLVKLEKMSPYLSVTGSLMNMSNLNNVKFRLYSEPDLKWWNKNKGKGYEDINAFYLEKLSNDLKSQYGDNHVEYITSEDKGYRTNGDRHPHSWSIVDMDNLISWINDGVE